jgi:hypothetical protein
MPIVKNNAISGFLESPAASDQNLSEQIVQEKAHSSLLAQEKKKSLAISNIGVSCDILIESFYTPIVVATTNPSYSSSTTLLHPLVMVLLVMPHLWLRMKP